MFDFIALIHLIGIAFCLAVPLGFLELLLPSGFAEVIRDHAEALFHFPASPAPASRVS